MGDGPLPFGIFIQIEPGHLVVESGVGLRHDGTAEVVFHKLAERPVHRRFAEEVGLETGVGEEGVNDRALGGAREHETEGVVAKVGEADGAEGLPRRRGILRHGMLNRDTQNQLFIAQVYVLVVQLILICQHHKDQVQKSLGEHLVLVADLVLLQMDRDPGIPLIERGGDIEKHIHAVLKGQSPEDIPRDIVGQILDHRVCVVFEFDHLPGVIYIDFPGLRQVQVAFIPLEQLDVQFLFQPDQLLV